MEEDTNSLNERLKGEDTKEQLESADYIISYEEFTPEEGSLECEYSINPQISTFQNQSENTQLQRYVESLEIDCTTYLADNKSLQEEIHQCSLDYMTILEQNNDLQNRLKEQNKRQEEEISELVRILDPASTCKDSNYLKEKVKEIIDRIDGLYAESKDLEEENRKIKGKEERKADRPKSSKKKNFEKTESPSSNLLKGLQEGLSTCNASLARLKKFQDLHKKYNI